MKIWATISFFVMLATLPTITVSQEDPAREAALRLMEVSGVKEAMQTMYLQTIDLQIKQNPTLAPFRRVFVEWNEQYTNYESIKDELADVYLTYFTVSELNEIADFYSSEIGQKSVQQIPQIMAESSAIGEAAAQRHLPELQQMIQLETQRLQDLQSQQ